MKSIFRKSPPPVPQPAAPESVFLALVRQPDLLPFIAQFQPGSPPDIAATIKKYRKQLKKAEYASVDASNDGELRCFVLFKLLADGRSSPVRRLRQHYRDGYVCPRLPSSDLYAMDAAARLGDLDTLTFLHERGLGRCSTSAMDVAASMGHIRIVQYLHRHRREGCTQLAFVLARRHGHTRVLAYLQTHCADWERRPTSIHASGKEGAVTGGMVAASCILQ
ncbi:hypothetical protein ACHHYP_04947 [Achlya hypogyna]|uniref:Ankyrin repeat protein n=1 Tax=Achlya hypogyna TaxID=1202772 RepID=A0A1V9YZH7_ACHHY|nr:hypothetical protein ACHHYP_04947 [Achlya hypogyna]